MQVPHHKSKPNCKLQKISKTSKAALVYNQLQMLSSNLVYGVYSDWQADCCSQTMQPEADDMIIETATAEPRK